MIITTGVSYLLKSIFVILFLILFMTNFFNYTNLCKKLQRKDSVSLDNKRFLIKHKYLFILSAILVLVSSIISFQDGWSWSYPNIRFYIF